MKIKRICNTCKKKFWVMVYRIKHGRGKYCSLKCRYKNCKGKNSPSWKGGKIKTSQGYIMLYKPSHPFNKQNYVMESRIIMEKHLGRYLKPSEVVHHINNIRDDNRIKNLQLFSNGSEHRIMAHGNIIKNAIKKLVGKTPWNKGKKMPYPAWNKGKKGLFKHSPETRNKISQASYKMWGKRKNHSSIAPSV